MGKFRAWPLFLLAACGSDHGSTADAQVIVTKDAAIDAKIFMDAPPASYDFSCMSNPAPMDGQAPADITLSGTVQEIAYTPPADISIQPVVGATLNGCRAGAADCMGTNLLAGPVDSMASGGWSLGPIATMTNPVDGYMTVTKTDYKSINIFPPQKLIADQGMIPALTFTNDTFDDLVTFGQIDQDAANGTMAVFVTDCANTPIGGATVTVKQGGNAVPNTTDFDAGDLDPMGAGVHLIFNVPPGDTEVGATFDSQTLQVHVVKVVMGEMTETVVRPGYF